MFVGTQFFISKGVATTHTHANVGIHSYSGICCLAINGNGLLEHIM